MGTVVLSIDAELAWGFHDLPDPPMERIRVARDAWRWLLAELDDWHIPATWAVVGHLFHDECDGRHDSLTVPPGWFDRDPGGTHHDKRRWFGSGLIDAIREAETQHDIGCHTYSHLSINTPGVTAAMFEQELSTFQALAEERDIEATSFVYPRNVIGYRPLLAQYGFRGYRGLPPMPWHFHTPLRPATKAISLYGGEEAAPMVSPRVDEFGLVDVPASLYLYGFEGPLANGMRKLAGDPILRAARRGIERVATQPGVFHLWLHPNNLVSRRERVRLRAILATIDRTRSQRSLTVRTMEEVIDRHVPS